MKKKSLLFINGHLNTGGVEKALLDILTHMDYDQYDVDLLLTEELGDYASQVPEQVNMMLRSIEGTYGSPVSVILRSLKRRDWFSLKMRLIFLAAKFFGPGCFRLSRNLMTGGKHYDVVISFRPGFCTPLAAYAANADCRITWWHHGEINVEKKGYLDAALRCDRVAVVSDACREMLAESFPALRSRMTTIHNMLDVDAVVRKADAYDPGFEDGMFHITSVGRLAPEKHFENAIAAAAALKAHGIRFRWHLLGEGVMQEKLTHIADELDVRDCFIFEGNQVNPYPYIKKADLFVHPSYVESFGIVVTEALALGVPCVITKSAGVMEFLRDGENALLTEQSAESLTDKVIEVLENRMLREKLCAGARCPEEFLPEAVMKDIAVLLDDTAFKRGNI